MNTEQLKILLNTKNSTELKTIIVQLFKKIPDAKDYIEVNVPLEKEVIQQNIEKLLKKYKSKLKKFLNPHVPEENYEEEKAIKLIDKIRRMDIDAKAIVECELYFIQCFKNFVINYGFFDEDSYIEIERVFESACKRMLSHQIVNNYKEDIDDVVSFGYRYGIFLDDICNDLKIPYTILKGKYS